MEPDPELAARTGASQYWTSSTTLLPVNVLYTLYNNFFCPKNPNFFGSGSTTLIHSVHSWFRLQSNMIKPYVQCRESLSKLKHCFCTKVTDQRLPWRMESAAFTLSCGALEPQALKSAVSGGALEPLALKSAVSCRALEPLALALKSAVSCGASLVFCGAFELLALKTAPLIMNCTSALLLPN